MKTALLKDSQDLHSICSSNGLHLSRRKDEEGYDGGSGRHLKMGRKRKAKHSRRHKKSKRRKSPDSAESGDKFAMDTEQSDEELLALNRDMEMWDLEFGPYKGSCTTKDAAEMITSLCAVCDTKHM